MVNYLKSKLAKLIKRSKNRKTFDYTKPSIQVIVTCNSFNYRTLLNIMHYTNYNIYFISFTIKNIYNYYEYNYVRDRIKIGLSNSAMNNNILTDNYLLYKVFKSIKKKNNVIKLDFITKKKHLNDNNLLPYFYHPSLYNSNFCLNENKSLFESLKTKKIRIVCAFGTFIKAYENGFLEDNFGIPNRNTVMDYLLSFPHHSIDYNGDKIKIIRIHDVLCVTNYPSSKVGLSNYLNLLGESDFFVQLPGLIMPVAHNLYEGILKGSIPVLSHEISFISPNKNLPFENLVYNSVKELLNCFLRISNMNENTINLMKKYWVENSSTVNDFVLDFNRERLVVLNESKPHLKLLTSDINKQDA